MMSEEGACCGEGGKQEACAELEAKQLQNQEKIEKLEESLKEKDRLIKKLKETIENKDTELNVAKDALTEAKDSIDHQKLESKQTTSDKDSHIARLRRKIQTLEEEKVAAEQRYENLKKEMQRDYDELWVIKKELEAEIESLKETCASKEDVEKQIATCRSDMVTQFQGLVQHGVEQSPMIQSIALQILKLDKMQQEISEISKKLDKKDWFSPPLITGEAESDSNPHDKKVTSRCTLSYPVSDYDSESYSQEPSQEDTDNH